MEYLRLDHVVIVVRDILQATEDYERLLGMQATHTAMQHPDKGFSDTFFYLGDSGSFIELCQPTDTARQAGAAMNRGLERNGEGIHNIALAVDNIEEATEQSQQRAVEPIQSQHSNSFFFHPRQAHGALIQVLQRF